MELEAYGPMLAQYGGQGELHASGGRIFKGPVRCGQLRDGHTILLFNPSSDPGNFPITYPIEADHLEGVDSCGRLVQCRGLLSINDLTSPSGFLQNYAARARQIEVRPDRSEAPEFIEYSLVNFRFTGDPSLGDRNNDVRAFRVESEFNGAEARFEFRSVEGYSQVSRRLQATRGIEPTSVLRIPGSQPDPGALADAICYLLSISRGTKIQWVSHRELFTTGPPDAVVHYNRVTRPYVGLGPIDVELLDPTVEFLQASLPEYAERASSYRFDRGLLDAVIDARVEGDFIETRAAKLAIALEALKAVHPASEFILDPAEMDELLPDLVQAVESVLREGQIKKSKIEQIGGVGGVRGLNRRSFRSQLRAVLKDIGITLSHREASLFIACRNKLVHTGRFYCAAGTPEEFERVEPLASKLDEYLFMLHTLDRIFLALVGWKGTYLDRRIPSAPAPILVTEFLL